MIAREFPPSPGGIGYYVYYLSKKLQEKGHKITVITRGTNSKTTKDVVNGVDVFHVTFFPLYPFHIWIHGAFVNRVIKSLESKLDLIHLHTPLPPPIKTSLPILTTVHTPMMVDAGYHEIVDLFSLAERVQSAVVSPYYESKLFKASNKITSVSLTVARELEQYGLNQKEITVIGNGVNQKDFVPARNNKPIERYVLYTGGLQARKGLFDFIDCASRVCKVYSDLKFVISGKGIFIQKLQERVRKLGLQNKVVFLGYVARNRLIEVYQNATVQIVPSHYEGLPTVLLEGMSCGLPVVATNIGGNNEVISSGVNGFLVPPKCPEEMAKTVLSLLDDAVLRNKIGKAARKTIENYYTWDIIADKTIKSYESIF